MNLSDQLQQNVRDCLEKNYHVSPEQHLLLVYDQRCTLSKLLAGAYQHVLSSHQHQVIDFDQISEQALIDTFAALPPKSLVILVQSTSFRLTKHRLRADLFRAGHQVIEHTRLSFNRDDQLEQYCEALRYDTPYYVKTTNEIARLLEENNSLYVESGDGLVLEVNSAFERSIKNTGDFSGNPVASAGFPIGEIFTEARELKQMNGRVLVFGFPTLEHRTHFCDPFVVQITDGCLVSHNGPAAFEEILTLIRAEETGGNVQVREIGFGLNKALGPEKRLDEPTAFERFAGMHFSLGLKHALYIKKLGRKVFQKYHIDIFCRVNRIVIGKTEIFRDGKYVI